MRDYATTAAGFDLQRTAAATLSGTLQALNACVECCDRHALPGRIALFWEGKDGSRASYTFSEPESALRTFRQFPPGPGRTPGRLRRRPVAAHARASGHHPRRLAPGRGVPAAVHRLRPEGHRTPRGDRRQQGAGHRCGQPRQARRTRRSASGRHRRRTEGAGHPSRRFQLLGRAGALSGRIRTGSAQRRGSVPDDVHLRHHRPGQTGAGAAQGDPRLRRLPARGGGPAPRGRLLEPRRSGLGLRPLLRCRRSPRHGPSDHLLRRAVQRGKHLPDHP